MSKTLQRLYRHIAIRDDTYEQIKNEGKFGESFDTVVRWILAEHEARKKGELVIS